MTDLPIPRRDWIVEAATASTRELRAVASAIFAFTRDPFRFAAAWRAGTSSAMNPFGVLASSAVVVGITRELATEALGTKTADGLLAAALTAMGPYVHYAALALCIHVVLRLLTREAVGWRDSIAIGLYAGGGPAAIAESAVWLVAAAMKAAGGGPSRTLIGIGLGVAFTAFCAALAFGMAGLFKPRPWHVLVAFSVAFPLSGLLFGELRPPGHYGMHWVVTIRGAGAPRIGLGW